MLKRTTTAARALPKMLGEPHALLEQLGSADGLFSLSLAAATLPCPPVNDRPALLCFLGRFLDQIVIETEWPVIRSAHEYGSRNQVRELIALDNEVGRQLPAGAYRERSSQLGLRHLRHLHPLRDQRTVQRYLHAVEEGHAGGWHDLVFGLTLAVYSLPLGQSLLRYARGALSGIVASAAAHLGLDAASSQAILHQATAELSPRLQSFLETQPAPGLRVLP